MNEKLRLQKIDRSRLSVKHENDTPCVFFNGSMILIMLESKKVNERRYTVYYRSETYDYVLARGDYHEGNFQVSWDSGYYGNINEVLSEYGTL